MFPGSLNGSDPLLRNLAESSPARRRTVSGMQDAYAHGGGDDVSVTVLVTPNDPANIEGCFSWRHYNRNWKWRSG